ncbi:MAG: T9SS type A sorting domain-containing protein, partial [Chitinophagales bacterium]
VTADPDMGLMSGSASTIDSAWVLLFDFTDATGHILATSDGGLNWAEQDSGLLFNGPLSFPNFIYFWDSNEGIVMGDPNGVDNNYEIYRTLNGGDDWILIDTAEIPDPTPGEAGYVNNFFVLGDDIWFGTFLNKIYHSENRGQTWSASALNGDANIAGPIAFKDAENGISIVTELPDKKFGGIYSTSNGGDTWTEIITSGSVGLLDLDIVTGTSIYVSCASSGPFEGFSSMSVDDGVTWTLIDTTGAGTDAGYSSLDFLSNEIGWAGGFTTSSTEGGVSKWNGAPFAIENINDEKSITVFPNPTSDFIVLNFAPGNHAEIKIQITSIDGQIEFSSEIYPATNLINEKINISNLVKGIYVVSAFNETEMISRKFIVK